MQFRAHQLKQACLWHAAVEGPASKSKSLFGLIAVAAVLADNVFASAASSIIDALREATSVNSQLQTCCSFLCLDACCDSSAAASVEHMQVVAISAHTVRLPTTHRCSIAADSLTDRQLANTLRTPPPANQLSAHNSLPTALLAVANQNTSRKACHVKAICLAIRLVLNSWVPSDNSGLGGICRKSAHVAPPVPIRSECERSAVTVALDTE